MKTAIAILTYRRLNALSTMVEGLEQLCTRYPIGIFEDCGVADGTSAWLTRGPVTDRDDLLATHSQFSGNIHAFLGKRNLGVAGNSNRAIKWFMDESGADHLCLCNDDLHVLGDFPAFYRQAHQDLDCSFFCFNDFWESPTHRWIIARCRGYRVKVFPRMTAIMVSTTRKAIEKVGYFDTRFGKFGEEHCDWNNRMRMAKLIQLDGLDQPCMDVEPSNPDGSAALPLLRHQDVPTSMSGPEREKEDRIAMQRIREAAARYATEHYYRPFSLIHASTLGGLKDIGIRADDVPKYQAVTCS